MVQKLQAAAKKAKANVELVAPTVGMTRLTGNKTIEANQTIDGGPSVLYDAIAVVLSEAGAEALAQSPAARDFVSDAFAHRKFVGYVPEARALFEAVGLASQLDDGFVALEGTKAPAEFLARCRQLRFWDRENALTHAR